MLLCSLLQSGATGDVASPPSKKVSECVRCFQCHVISCDHQELLQAARKESDKADNLVRGCKSETLPSRLVILFSSLCCMYHASLVL